jgi:hypothetical protein
VSWGAKGLFGVELEIAVMVPTLKGKGKALIVEKFKIKLIFRRSRDED